MLEAQAAAAGLPLHIVSLPWPCSNEQYESAMRAACDTAIASGIQAIAFGDLFLEDIRQYREDRLRGTGLTPLFPVWKLDTRTLLLEMIAAGVKTRIVCVDPRKLPREFAGRDLNEDLLHDLPQGVDPLWRKWRISHLRLPMGPMFQHPIPIESGEVVERDGFVFADVLLRK